MKWLLILFGILALLVVGHFDRPEDHSFPLAAKNRVEVISRHGQSPCATDVAYNK